MSKRSNKLAALVAGTALALGFGEIVIRIIEPIADSTATLLSDSERLYAYDANSTGYAGGVPFRTNGMGFRGPDFQPRSDALVIVALGDSYTFGYGVASEEAFPAVLERRLSSQFTDRAISVVNLGMPGYNTRQSIATLKEVGGRVRPDIVLLGYVLNDIQGQYEGQEAIQRGFRGVLYGLRDKVHLLRMLFPQAARIARAVGLHVKTTATQEVDEYVGGGTAWTRNQAALLELNDICRGLGAELAVMVMPYFVQFDDRHPALPAYDTVVDFLRSHGIAAVSAFGYFKGTDARDYWINPFDGHPDAAGHRVLAQTADDLLSGIVSRRAASPHSG